MLYSSNQLSSEDAGVPGDVGLAIVAEHLDRVRLSIVAEAGLDGLQHHVADIRAADAGVHQGPPGDDLLVMRVDDEGSSDDIAVPAGQLEAVREPAQVRAHGDDLALMRLLRPLGVSARQQ